MRRRRAGFNLAEAAVAITLLAGAVFFVGSLTDNHSRQLSRLERTQAPSHARLELAPGELFLVAEGATEASTTHDLEVLSLTTREQAGRRLLEAEVTLVER